MSSQNSNQLGGTSSNTTAGGTSGLADLRERGSAGSGHRGKSYERPEPLRIGSLNVGTMRGKANEVVETMSRRKIDILCLQETRWKNQGVRKISGKDTQCKFLWSGNDSGVAGVGVLLAEKWWEKVFEVTRTSDRIMLVRLVVGKVVFALVCIYAPQVGISEDDKNRFYEQLQSLVATVPPSEELIVCGDWNGHIGSEQDGYPEVHGGHAIGKRNAEGERILEFAVANDLVIGNSLFKKKPRHLVTYQSGEVTTQIDYILYRRSFRKHVTNVKVILGEECAPQHKLLVCDLKATATRNAKRKFRPRIKLWKLKDPATKEEFAELFSKKTEGPRPEHVEDLWRILKDGMIESAKETCGVSSSHQWRHQTWWWNDKVEKAVQEKRQCFKAWKAGGSRETYNTAKRAARHAVYLAKSEADKEVFQNINSKSGDIYKVAKQMRRDNQDVMGEKPVRNDAGELSLDVDAKKEAWKQHYQRLLNVEFPWNPEDLSVEPPVEGPSVPITHEMIEKAVNRMHIGKAAGPSEIVAEMLKPTGKAGTALIRDLVEAVVREKRIPTDWEESYIVSIYKGKGDALDRGNYRGLKLIDQAMKVLERVVETLIRQQVQIDEMQYGFMPGRGTTDAIFILRQLQEKHQAANKPLYMAFVDLEKAFDRVPRTVIWWAMRKLGIGEWLVQTVQSMYNNARSRVRVGDDYSDEFGVEVGVHQGSVLSPLLFVIVLEALSQEFRTSCPWELLYADDLAITDTSLERLTERLSQWKNGMETKGLRVNMGKTKVMISGPNLDSLRKSGKYPCAVCLSGTGRNSILCTVCSCWVHKKCSGIKTALKPDDRYKCPRCEGAARPIDGRPMTALEIGGDKLEVVTEFCYLGDTLSAGGGCELAVTTRCRSAWKKFRELLPILTSKYLPNSTRGRVYSACIRSVLLYGAETWAITSSTLKKLVRNDRAMVRWTCRTKPEDDTPYPTLLALLNLRDIGDVIQNSRLRWLGHVERSSSWISQVRTLPVAALRGPGRPKLTWENLVKRDCEEKGMTDINPQDRPAWRGRLRSSTGQPGPTLMKD